MVRLGCAERRSKGRLRRRRCKDARRRSAKAGRARTGAEGRRGCGGTPGETREGGGQQWRCSNDGMAASPPHFAVLFRPELLLNYTTLLLPSQLTYALLAHPLHSTQTPRIPLPRPHSPWYSTRPFLVLVTYRSQDGGFEWWRKSKRSSNGDGRVCYRARELFLSSTPRWKLISSSIADQLVPLLAESSHPSFYFLDSPLVDQALHPHLLDRHHYPPFCSTRRTFV